MGCWYLTWLLGGCTAMLSLLLLGGKESHLGPRVSLGSYYGFAAWVLLRYRTWLLGGCYALPVAC